ncbi:MAG: serine/threonine protein phosphatase, partial [Deltaproteobacteria bacterium]|nr:serine/threonine protein phosphatase [Deltaproteobacteria bacterium]
MTGCRSLRTRMMAWVLAVAGLVLIAVICLSYASSRQRLEMDMEIKAGLLADVAAQQIDAQLGPLQGVIHGLALALEASENMPFPQIRRLQTDCLRANPGIFGVCVAFNPEPETARDRDLAPWEYRVGNGLKYEDLSGPHHDHTREDWFTLPQYLKRP